MIRPRLVGIVTLSLIVSTSFISTAAPPKKKAKGSQPKVLEVGDEVIFKLIGDEIRGQTKAEKVGIVRGESLLLPSLVPSVYSDRDEPANRDAIDRYVSAMVSADRIRACPDRS
jgi:hypothetical protein